MTGRITCPACGRLVQARKDGRVRAHLGTRGVRGACEGSGRLSVHVEMAISGAEEARATGYREPAPRLDMTPAERFNAADDWALVDALFIELKLMEAAGGASERAIADQKAALGRAWDTAQARAPWHLYGGTQDGDAA